MADARATPPLTGTNAKRACGVSFELKTRYWSNAVQTGVRDLTVCIKDTGTNRRLMFPRQMLQQKTTAMTSSFW